MPKITEKDGALRFEVHAKPRAKKSRVVSVEPTVEVALAAPPVDGAANDELVRFLAEVLGLPKRAIGLVRGESSRHKQVSVVGMSPEELTARLLAACGG
jgi:uncharacterized protein (TIGR00251 family)